MNLPQHDQSIIPNRRAAERMLNMLNPNVPPDPETGRPTIYASHRFMVAADAPDAPLPMPFKVAGTIAQHFDTLARMNRTMRTGVHVEVDAAVNIVAEMDLDRERARTELPLQPSIGILYGSHKWQLVWRVEAPLPAKVREGVVDRIKGYAIDNGTAAKVTWKGPALLRVAGFHSRFARPVPVIAEGLRETCGQRSGRYTAAQMIEGFKLAQREAAA
jgi:hypothetical protein